MLSSDISLIPRLCRLSGCPRISLARLHQCATLGRAAFEIRFRSRPSFREKLDQFVCDQAAKRAQKLRPSGTRNRWNRSNQRFENWKDLRAFALPYFLRSTERESRVRKPPFFRTPRR